MMAGQATCVRAAGVASTASVTCAMAMVSATVIEAC